MDFGTFLITGPGVNTLQIGDDIIGEVQSATKVAIIRIISVEKEECRKNRYPPSSCLQILL